MLNGMTASDRRLPIVVKNLNRSQRCRRVIPRNPNLHFNDVRTRHTGSFDVRFLIGRLFSSTLPSQNGQDGLCRVSYSLFTCTHYSDLSQWRIQWEGRAKDQGLSWPFSIKKKKYTNFNKTLIFKRIIGHTQWT